MSEILKTEAIVLSKLNYSDSSIIASLFTKEFGKLSAIIKGGRQKGSKIGRMVDPPNLIDIVLYSKDTREIQVLSSADLIQHYANLKEDYDSLIYAYAILELIKNLMMEHEKNLRMFSGVKRILELMNKKSELSEVLFGRFFVFFLTEIGYELQLDICAECKKEIVPDEIGVFNYMSGAVCMKCCGAKNHPEPMTMELFELLVSLKNGNKIEGYRTSVMESLLTFLERYLKVHVENFKGLQSLQLK